MIVLIRIQNAFTPLPLRVILIVSGCFYMDMNFFGPIRVVSSLLRVGSVAADIFGWVVADGFGWLQMVSGGFGWFVVLVVTICHLEIQCIYLKNREFLQNFKNLAGDELKLPKREPPAVIGRVSMSGMVNSFIIIKDQK